MHDKVRGRTRRDIPSVDSIMRQLGESALPRSVIVSRIRRRLAAARSEPRIPSSDDIIAQLRAEVADLALTRLQPIINGTGIIVHTNFGRAPLAAPAIDALTQVAQNYSNLEYELAKGERGHRAAYLEANLAALCRAEAATIVNNCAAALVLVLRHFTAGEKREVVISRGELIQIGGGFRIPDILQATGAILREVGTTNRTSIDDYARVCGKSTAMILKVHRSNFFMDGFVESASTESIAQLARRKRIPLIEDLGSGAIVSTDEFGEHETTPAQAIRRGVDLVTFSGDKLFGGPQGGIIAGRKKHVAAVKREPFFRALRCDKLVLAALEATVDLYLSDAEKTIPVVSLLQSSCDELCSRAEKLLPKLRESGLTITIGSGKAQVGGGTLPRSAIRSVTLDFQCEDLREFAARLRRTIPPVIGYIAGGKFKIDLRTVFPRQDEHLAGAIAAAAGTR